MKVALILALAYVFMGAVTLRPAQGATVTARSVTHVTQGETLAEATALVYQIDLSRYFASAEAETRSRATVIANAKAFAASSTPVTPTILLHWLQRYDALLMDLERHDIYVYLKAEENDEDTADAKADDALGNAEQLISDRVVTAAQYLGESRIARFTRNHSLAPYSYLLTNSLGQAAHRLNAAEARSVTLAVTPVLDAASVSYRALRKSSATIETAKMLTPRCSFRLRARETAWRDYAASPRPRKQRTSTGRSTLRRSSERCKPCAIRAPTRDISPSRAKRRSRLSRPRRFPLPTLFH